VSIDLVTRFLDEAGVAYEVVEHEPTYSAAQEAAAAGADTRHTAKTLLLHDRDGWRVAVLPANHRLDLQKTRRLLRGSQHLRLATEDEMEAGFPAFEVGALPPVGPMLPLPEVVDIRLLYSERLVCPGGDHCHSIKLDPRDLLTLAEPRVGDLCEREGPPRRKGFAELPKV
jgi:Ala-tRNA(Pro) deacylase